MQIHFSPQRRPDRLTVETDGDTLVLNGERFDFTPLAEGNTLPKEAIDSPWFAGPVERIGGQIVLRLILPHGTTAPQATLFPEPMTVTKSGPVKVPAYEVAK